MNEDRNGKVCNRVDIDKDDLQLKLPEFIFQIAFHPLSIV